MADDNLPAEAGPEVTTPPTYESQVEDISNLLEDPATDLPEEPEDDAAAAPEDDPLGLEAEDVEAAADADSPDESDEPEIKGGRFAPDSAKVTLDDGTVTTIAELKRGSLFQRDYTQKTQQLSEERKSFDAERQQVVEYAQSLTQAREYLAWYAENFAPKQPEPFKGAPDDYVGFIEWQRQDAAWRAHMDAYNTFQQQKTADEQRKSGETQQQAKARLERERQALHKAIPILKDPVKGKALWGALVKGAAEHYGITEQEVNTVGDHRMLVALRDALAYRQIKAKAPQVPAQVAQRPAMTGGRRAAPNARVTREKQVRSERLRNSGSFNDAVAALQDLDL